mgnify:CR=1 FL=1
MIYDSDHIVVKQCSFNGNESVTKYINPWAEKVPYWGSNAGHNAPDI